MSGKSLVEIIRKLSFEDPPLLASVTFSPKHLNTSELKSSCNLVAVCLLGFTFTLFILASYTAALLHPLPCQGFNTGDRRSEKTSHWLSTQPPQVWCPSAFPVLIHTVTTKIKQAGLVLTTGGCVCFSRSVMSNSL